MLGKLAVVGALALGILGLLAVSSPAPAAAAQVSYTSYCFKHPNGAAWSNRPVYAERYLNGRIYQIGVSESNIRGCGAFYMPTNSVVRVRAYLRLANSVFRGYTRWAIAYRGGRVNLGMGIVYW